jgi:hypothetical protein
MIVRKITIEEKTRSLNFAKEIILGGNQYDRFNQSITKQIERTYIGKLAEYVFLHFLHSRNILIEEGEMFEVFQGAENVDNFDFLLPNGQSIDIKTASMPFHTRIMIPIDQFRLKKDFYVGVKLNFFNSDSCLDLTSLETANICGFIDRFTLENRPVEFFGEGNCKAFKLVDLLDIDELIKMYYDT